MKAVKIFAVAGCAFLASALLAGCNKKVADEESQAETVFAVNVYKAVPRNLDDYLEFGGNVQTASSVDIYPDVQSGKLSRILVKVGDKVKKGDVLVIIEAMKLENEVVSPFEGQIAQILVTKGQNVKAKDVIVTIE